MSGDNRSCKYCAFSSLDALSLLTLFRHAIEAVERLLEVTSCQILRVLIAYVHGECLQRRVLARTQWTSARFLVCNNVITLQCTCIYTQRSLDHSLPGELCSRAVGRCRSAENACDKCDIHMATRCCAFSYESTRIPVVESLYRTMYTRVDARL